MNSQIRAAVAPAFKPLAEATRLEADAGVLTGRTLAMHIVQSRRDFLAALSTAGAAGAGISVREERP
jgi:hypothetical protein